MMQTNFLEIIRTRRSCRSYKPDQITDEQLNNVLEAGTYAPTSRGLQSPFIVAVQNEELKQRLAQMNAEVNTCQTETFFCINHALLGNHINKYCNSCQTHKRRKIKNC